MIAPDSRTIEAIMAVMDSAFDPAFGEAWNRAQLISAMVIPQSWHALIDVSGRISSDPPRGDGRPIAGFCLTRSVIDETELLLIAVAPQYRGHGLAGQLVSHMTETCREQNCARVFLEMREDNPARSLYLRHGFRPVGRRRGYYTGNDRCVRDAITFSLDLREGIGKL